MSIREPAARGRMRRRSRVVPVVLASLLSVAVVAAIAVVALNPQRVVDRITVWQFEPNAALADAAQRTTMTDEGRFLFFASRPSIEADEAFDKICASHAEDVGILGCYVQRDKRIYLYDVTDERLDGIEDVVAAHEMLHAAWDRMSVEQQRRLEGLLEAEVAARADDTELARTLEFYAAAEPGQRGNELHSIMGTEYADLGEELEAHYAAYFGDRAALVALHERSNAVFLAQRSAIEQLVAELEALAASIDSDYAAYNAGYDELNAQIVDFNSRAEAGAFESFDEFTAERDALMARQAELDALYASIDARVTEYETLLARLDELNAEVDELNQSINVPPRPEAELEP